MWLAMDKLCKILTSVSAKQKYNDSFVRRMMLIGKDICGMRHNKHFISLARLNWKEAQLSICKKNNPFNKNQPKENKYKIAGK
jgi:hypothetical protein